MGSWILSKVRKSAKIKEIKGCGTGFWFLQGFRGGYKGGGWNAIKELKLKSLIFKTKCDDISGEEGVCR